MKTKTSQTSSKSSDVPRFIITPEEMLVLGKAEEAVGEPAIEWQGRCYEIASILADHMENAQAVYGHYRGYIDPTGYWGGYIGEGFVQHGWIIFRDFNQIIDPTRWSFENRPPYIYYGKNMHDGYDEGGNDYRGCDQKPCPSFDHTKRVVKFHKATPDSALARHLNCLLPSIRMEKCLRIDIEQAFWLANAHYCRLEPFVKEIYQGLADANYRGFIPIDNWNRAFRVWG